MIEPQEIATGSRSRKRFFCADWDELYLAMSAYRHKTKHKSKKLTGRGQGPDSDSRGIVSGTVGAATDRLRAPGSPWRPRLVQCVTSPVKGALAGRLRGAPCR